MKKQVKGNSHAAADPERQAIEIGEIKDRKALIAQIEEEMPYSRQLYINDIKINLNRSLDSIIRAGKELLVVREREGYGEFVTILEEEIGIPHTTAYRFMNAAIKTTKYPSITFPTVGKVYAFIEAPEEELKKFEQLGLFGGKDKDDIEAMSVKELRALARDLKDKKELYVNKELKKIKDKLADITRERDLLRRKHPEDWGTWVTGMRPLIAQTWENFLVLWKDFVANEHTQLNDEAQDFMVEFYDRIFADLDSIDETRYGKTGDRYTRKKK